MVILEVIRSNSLGTTNFCPICNNNPYGSIRSIWSNIHFHSYSLKSFIFGIESNQFQTHTWRKYNQKGGSTVPLRQGAVASDQWLTASATAVVAGRGGMFVSKVTLRFWHDWATAWSGKRLQIYHKRVKPQVALSWNLLELKKKAKAKKSREETNKRDIFGQMLCMFSIRREYLALSLFPSLSCVPQLHQELAWTDSWTQKISSVRLQASRQLQGSPPLNTKAQVTPRKHGFKGYTQSPNMWPIAQRRPAQTETQKPQVCHCPFHMTWTPHRVTVRHDSCNWALEPSHWFTCTDSNAPALNDHQLWSFTQAGSKVTFHIWS